MDDDSDDRGYDPDEWQRCAECGTDDDLPYYECDDGEYICLNCAEDAASETEDECRAYAREHVRLTSKPHQYDDDYYYVPTREEYRWEGRRAYTPRAVAAYNRHECTNYDDLIQGLDRCDPWDRVLYRAIRARVYALTDRSAPHAEYYADV